MPIVQVQMLPGRPTEMIEQLGREMTDLVQRTLNVPRDTIRVVVSEVQPTHWFKDGRSISEIMRDRR